MYYAEKYKKYMENINGIKYEKMTETNNDYFWIYERIKEIDEEIAQRRHEKAFLESLLQRNSPCIFKSKSSDTSIFDNEKY